MPPNMPNQATDCIEVANQLQSMNSPHDTRGVSADEHDSVRNPSTTEMYPSYVYTDSRVPAFVARGTRTAPSKSHTLQNTPSDPVTELTDARSTYYTDNANSTQILRVTVPIKTDT